MDIVAELRTAGIDVRVGNSLPGSPGDFRIVETGRSLPGWESANAARADADRPMAVVDVDGVLWLFAAGPVAGQESAPVFVDGSPVSDATADTVDVLGAVLVAAATLGNPDWPGDDAPDDDVDEVLADVEARQAAREASDDDDDTEQE